MHPLPCARQSRRERVRRRDESLSTGIGATDLTVSFSRFYNTEKGTLLGWGPGVEEDANTRVTIHHSAYLTGPHRSGSRIPKLRRGMVHFVNDVVDGWGWSGVEVTMGGQGQIEYNIFDGCGDSQPAMVCNADGYDSEGGFICDRSNALEGAIPDAGLSPDVPRVIFDTDQRVVLHLRQRTPILHTPRRGHHTRRDRCADGRAAAVSPPETVRVFPPFASPVT